MSAGLKNDDCFFYFNSVCAKGLDCPYRHEPSARATTTVCFYWQTSYCTRQSCSFRHGEVSAPGAAVRSVQQCFWELQSTGCQKPQCPFKHTKPKIKPIDSGSIILNRQKLETLQSILPAESITIHSDANKPKRVVVPPGTGLIARRAVTGGIKNRLGTQGDVKKRLGTREAPREDGANVRKRLGTREAASDKSSQNKDNQEEITIEEKSLRESAINSIDLRNRLDKEATVQPIEEEVRTVRRIGKKRKRDKNDNERSERKAKKKEKKEKKGKKRERGISEALSRRMSKPRSETELPSASDYSDLDTPLGSPDPDHITVMSKTTGMYADTKTFSQSAKIRLGKRKVTLSRESSPEIQILERRTVTRRSSQPDRDNLPLHTNKDLSDPIEILHKRDGGPKRSLSPLRNPSPPARSRSPPHKRSQYARSKSPPSNPSTSPIRASTTRKRSSSTPPALKDLSPSQVPSLSASRSPSPPPAKPIKHRDEPQDASQGEPSLKKPKKEKSKKVKKVKKDKSEKKKLKKESKSREGKKKKSSKESKVDVLADDGLELDSKGVELDTNTVEDIENDDDIIEKLDEMING